MTTLQTAEQVNTRNRLKDSLRTGFDVEFGRRRIKTWLFCILWLFLGNFGAHLIYMWIKKEEFPASGFVAFAYVGLWAKILSENEERSAIALMLLTVGVLVHGIVILVTGGLREINDQVASSVSASLR